MTESQITALMSRFSAIEIDQTGNNLAELGELHKQLNCIYRQLSKKMDEIHIVSDKIMSAFTVCRISPPSHIPHTEWMLSITVSKKDVENIGHIVAFCKEKDLVLRQEPVSETHEAFHLWGSSFTSDEFNRRIDQGAWFAEKYFDRRTGRYVDFDAINCRIISKRPREMDEMESVD